MEYSLHVSFPPRPPSGRAGTAAEAGSLPRRAGHTDLPSTLLAPLILVVPATGMAVGSWWVCRLASAHTWPLAGLLVTCYGGQLSGRERELSHSRRRVTCSVTVEMREYEPATPSEESQGRLRLTGHLPIIMMEGNRGGVAGPPQRPLTRAQAA